MNSKWKIALSVGVIFLITSITIGLFSSKLFFGQAELQYQEILGDYNKEFLTRSIGIGDISELRLLSKEILEEGYQHSVGGRYALDDVIFKPFDDWLTPWECKCKGKPQKWGSKISGDMKYFSVYVDIPIPDDPRLEEKTINGYP